MLKNIINEISQEFISEAIKSPNLLEDMAFMEKYMSESYSGRIFVELIQNADDCGSNKIILVEHNGDLIFANDGRCFDERDVISISRSGASSKERGTAIGYRGVGFKSTTYLSSEIIIFSDNTYFTFSKAICAKALSKSENKIPTVRIPFLVKEIDHKIDLYVQDLKVQGYITVFIFRNAKIIEFIEELKDINNGYFLFLNSINICRIDVKNIQKSFNIERDNCNVSSNALVTLRGKDSECWLIVNNNNASVAFKYENNKAMPCNTEEALYHCYLPTFDKVLFPIKVNSDFSTDPSRKHLTLDEITNHSILVVADLLFEIVCSVFTNEHNSSFSNILAILLKTNSFSKVNSLLKEHLKNRILSERWIKINNGTMISVKDYKLLPDWLEDAEKNIIRQKSRYVNELSLNADIYNNILQVENFLSQYSDSRFKIDELIEIMKDTVFASSISSQTHGKILANIIRTGKSAQFIGGQNYDYSQIAINTNNGISTFDEIAKSKTTIVESDVRQAINQNVGNGDIEWFCKKTQIDSEKILNKKDIQTIFAENVPTKIKASSKPVVSKWRSAEQQCVEIEKHFGNTAIDVSKQNVGYDVESTTPTGAKKYIEVKLLSGSGGAFTITNNEYTAAHQYGKDYFLCLITQNETEAKALYISNPLQNLNFEKRIRQWEWYCEQYTGHEYCIDIK